MKAVAVQDSRPWSEGNDYDFKPWHLGEVKGKEELKIQWDNLPEYYQNAISNESTNIFSVLEWAAESSPSIST